MRRTRWMGLLALVAAAGLIAIWTGRAAIGSWVYTRMVDERAGRDQLAGRPDGLHVFLCGTGSPLPDPQRAGPCTMIIAGRHIYVVDSGEGAARTIGLAGMPIGRVEGLFLTHFHSDHVDGIGPLMLMRWTQGTATSPLPVYGPAGVERVVAGFNAAYATDSGYRIAHHGPAIVPPSGAGGQAMPFADPPEGGALQVVLRRDGLVVSTFRVDHGPVRPAVGYRFDYRGRSVVISGDTAPTPAIARAARGADLLLHEALQPAMVGALTNRLAALGQRNTAQITRDILNYHSSPADAARAARAAGVRQLVLTHIVPALPTAALHATFLGDAADHFDGPIIVGEDAILFSLPARSDRIDMERL